MTETVEQARERREEARFDAIVDAYIDQRLSQVKLAAPISPQAKFKLRFILRKYAKSPHPFRACVKDNMKRFGPGRTEAVCATLKDTIKGRKDWRGKGKLSENEQSAVIDADVLLALDAISTVDLKQIFLEARALELYGSAESAALLSESEQDQFAFWGGRA